jgi:hypothetical protein
MSLTYNVYFHAYVLQRRFLDYIPNLVAILQLYAALSLARLALLS